MFFPYDLAIDGTNDSVRFGIALHAADTGSADVRWWQILADPLQIINDLPPVLLAVLGGFG
jgi:hypothetical protein